MGQGLARQGRIGKVMTQFLAQNGQSLLKITKMRLLTGQFADFFGHLRPLVDRAIAAKAWQIQTRFFVHPDISRFA